MHGKINLMAISELLALPDVEALRADFPILHQSLNGKPLVYLDNAATTQKPASVIKALSDYYEGYNANIHRGLHTLAEKATAAYEETREAVRDFINARETAEIIFTRGTTESINLVAQSWGRSNLQAGDEIIVSGMEHHSNIVPWQLAAAEKGAVIKHIPLTETGELDLEAYRSLLNERTRLVAFMYVSNAMGIINPAAEIIAEAHKAGALVLMDAAQAVAHIDIDVQALGADFLAFSSHKMYGPTGAGVLYGRRGLLEAMPPWQGGGEMIKEVSFSGSTWNELPYKFEAGTPNIADTIALKAAIDYINQFGKPALAALEHNLLTYATERLQALPGLRIIGTGPEKVSIVSFVLEGIHHQDIGIMLDTLGIAVRTGHHCAQPLMSGFNIAGTTRASFSFYNTSAEIDALEAGLSKVIRMFR